MVQWPGRSRTCSLRGRMIECGGALASVTLPGYMGAIYSHRAKLGSNYSSFYLLCPKEQKEKQLSVLGFGAL